MSYPNINDSNFNTRITQKYIKYTIPKKKKTFKQICFPKEFELQLPQQFLPQYINPKTPYKGVLVFHKIGSGKTCTAVNIAEQWKHMRNIIVVVPASLIGNFRGELRSKCAGNHYLIDSERKQLKTLHPTSNEYKEIIRKSDARIDKYYTIYSYNKFVDLAQRNKLCLKNSVLIIDEIQNMVSEDGTYYNVLYDAIHNAPKDLRVVLLSATPMFDKPVEIALTMNLLIPFKLPIGKEFERLFIKTTKNKTTGEYIYKAKNLDIFKERIKGYVSYYRGSPPYVFPESTIKYVKCEMGEFQYKSYVTVLKNEQHDKSQRIKNVQAFRETGLIDMPNNFLLGARLISNFAYPNKGIREDGYKSLTKQHLKLENLENYSIKFHKIIKKINACRGLVYVYSNFVEYCGLNDFAIALEANGYKNYAVNGTGRNRYAMITGNEKSSYKELVKNVYNHIDNVNGSKVKVLLLSSSVKVGLSLFAVRQIHIMEPHWNISALQQVIGRGLRTCSHKYLPEEKRNCKIYVYLATNNNEIETVDQYILKLANKKGKLINQFDNAMKECAIDCQLNKNANVYSELGEVGIKCDN